jgi:hypothetical protein
LQPKKQTSANRRHRLESPLQLPGTTVVREPPSAHKREQGGWPGRSQAASNAGRDHAGMQPPRPSSLPPRSSLGRPANVAASGRRSNHRQHARPAALPPPAPASTPREDGGAALPEPDPRRIQPQPRRGARPRQVRRRPRPGMPRRCSAPTDGVPNMRLHGENPPEAFGGEGARRHRVVGLRQRRRRGARVGEEPGGGG